MVTKATMVNLLTMIRIYQTNGSDHTDMGHLGNKGNHGNVSNHDNYCTKVTIATTLSKAYGDIEQSSVGTSAYQDFEPGCSPHRIILSNLPRKYIL